MKSRRDTEVCLLQPYPAPYRQGLFNELNRLLDGRLTILYFSREEEARKWSFERNVQFKEVLLKTRVKKISYNKVRARLNLFSLIAAFMQIRPGVVICTEYPSGPMMRLVQLVFRFKILFWTETNKITLGRVQPRKWRMNWVDRGAEAYIVPGRLSERYVRNVRGFAGKIWCVPNTIDRTIFACSESEVRNKFRAAELRFLFSGSLIELKGIYALLAAFKRLSDTPDMPSYRLDIIGDGPMEKQPVPNVHYHGYLSQSECAALTKQAHVLVLPSLQDCNPLVVAEATAAGCVTLLSDGVGNGPEYTNGNGCVFERGNADALYDVICKVLKMERPKLLKMALQSLEIASQVSHENSARIFSEAVSDCLEKLS